MSNTRVIRASKSTMDSMFFIPDGVEDTEYAVNLNDEENESLDDDEGELDVATPTPTTKKNTPTTTKKKPKAKAKKPKAKPKANGQPSKNQKVGTPKSLKIVSQKVTTKADGSQTVDVVVDVDKVKGADKYEFRITNKATGKTTVVGG